MKFACVVIGLALTLAGMGVACGPEEKYCFDDHKTCKQAALDKEAAEKDAVEKARQAAEAGEGVGDGGATVIGQ